MEMRTPFGFTSGLVGLRLSGFLPKSATRRDTFANPLHEGVYLAAVVAQLRRPPWVTLQTFAKIENARGCGSRKSPSHGRAGRGPTAGAFAVYKMAGQEDTFLP